MSVDNLLHSSAHVPVFVGRCVRSVLLHGVAEHTRVLSANTPYVAHSCIHCSAAGCAVSLGLPVGLDVAFFKVTLV
jgi:hypothetical protein